ncbi:MAG: autoinducer binding domain-containing protein [Burkholderiaceae bacterium]|nr:autoinducer binding domain-containing protein [Burkholderiaceae bacterium]
MSEFHLTLATAASLLGFDGYAAVVGHWLETPGTDLHWLAGADPVWCLTFMTRHGYLNSALLMYARATDRPAFGSEVAALTDGQRSMREVTRRFGYRCAVAFPRRLPPGTAAGDFGAVMFLGRTEPPAGEAGARRHTALVRGLVATFIDRWAQMVAAEQARQTRLSNIERRLLDAVAAGQTAARAARALGLSTTAVNNYYRRINAKLGVHDKRAALARARALGLLAAEPGCTD